MDIGFTEELINRISILEPTSERYMSISRRQFVIGSTATAVALFNLRRSFAQQGEQFSNELKIPPLLEGKPSVNGKIYELTMQAGTSEFLPGIATPTIGFNGSYLGPTIHGRAGDQLILRVRNLLSEPATVHWHGLRIPARFDGGPHQLIEPGAVWEPSFRINQKASLCWYHSHTMGRTGEQVLRGLAGLFLIDDDESGSVGLPTEYGVDDIPLVIQDRRFQRDGRFDYPMSMHDTMMGYKGDVILVNGSVTPHFNILRQLTRLRVLNGSNSRIYSIGRDDGADLMIVGSDGSLLERPVSQRQLRLGPGERAELLIDAKANQSFRLMSYPDSVHAGPMGRGMMMGTMSDNSETFPLLELRAANFETINVSIPTKLIQVPNWLPAKSTLTRTLTLDMAMMGMGMMGRSNLSGSMGINGRSMSKERIDFEVPAGSIEIWEIRNSTPLPHPFHIHGIQFRVLDRDGAPPLPQEGGLKDTVLVDSGSVVRVITEFTRAASAEYAYMYHCHNLEHEDAGMMGQFVVV
ncbi:MAG: oxidase [Bradyrhizobiaceae bacterium]|nr:MAG: oxidase [Bradyrhizobiaceae bacterium]